MVPGKLLEVLVEELIAGADDQRRTELLPPAARISLPVATCSCSKAGGDLGGLHQVEGAEVVRPDDLGGGTVFVQQHVEGHLFVLDERLGVAFAAGADGDHARPLCDDLVVSVADLTGPLTASQSAEMPEKQQDLRVMAPAVPESRFVGVGIDEDLISECGNVEWHGVQDGTDLVMEIKRASGSVFAIA